MSGSEFQTIRLKFLSPTSLHSILRHSRHGWLTVFAIVFSTTDSDSFCRYPLLSFDLSLRLSLSLSLLLSFVVEFMVYGHVIHLLYLDVYVFVFRFALRIVAVVEKFIRKCFDLLPLLLLDCLIRAVRRQCPSIVQLVSRSWLLATKSI